MLVINYTKKDCPNCTRMKAAYDGWVAKHPDHNISYFERDAVDYSEILKAEGFVQAPVWRVTDDRFQTDETVSGLDIAGLLGLLNKSLAEETE